MIQVLTGLASRVRECGRRTASKEQGATMVEYALLVTLIAIALVAALVAFRVGIGTSFENDATLIDSL